MINYLWTIDQKLSRDWLFPTQKLVLISIHPLHKTTSSRGDQNFHFSHYLVLGWVVYLSLSASLSLFGLNSRVRLRFGLCVEYNKFFIINEMKLILRCLSHTDQWLLIRWQIWWGIELQLRRQVNQCFAVGSWYRFEGFF